MAVIQSEEEDKGMSLNTSQGKCVLFVHMWVRKGGKGEEGGRGTGGCSVEVVYAND